MPKTNDASGPTYFGMEGHVVDSHDRVHEVDPSRKVTGEVVDGYESDEREIEDRAVISNEVAPQISPSDGLPTAPTPVPGAPAVGEAERKAREEAEQEDGTLPDPAKRPAPEQEKEVPSSPGSNSRSSRTTSAKLSQKSGSDK